MCRDIFRSCVLWSVVNLGQDYLFAEQWQLGHVWEVCFEVCVVAEQKWHASALTEAIYARVLWLICLWLHVFLLALVEMQLTNEIRQQQHVETHASTCALVPRDFRGPQGEIFICMCGTWLVLPVRLMIDQGKCARISAPNGTLPFPPLALEAFYSINSGPWSVKTHKHPLHTHADTDHNLHSSAWHPVTSVMLWKTHTTFVLLQWSCRCPVCHRVPMFLMPADEPPKSRLL